MSDEIDPLADAAPVDENRLAAVLAESIDGFVELRALERLSGGASQETYRIIIGTTDGERPLAMRRAPGGVVHQHEGRTAPGLAVEAKLMQVAGAVDVPEPVVHRILTEDDGLGAGFIMEWLDGVTLGARIVRAPELDEIRPQLAFQCGEILARIHAIDLDATGLRNDLDELTPEEYLHQTWDRYKEYPTPQPMIDYAGQWLLDHLPDEPVTGVLVHNDFRNGNVMVDPTGVTAVLDWETAHIGDPMRDLGWICTGSWRFGRRDLAVGGFGKLDDLVAGYESVTGVPVDVDRVKWWEVFGSFWWAIGCLGMAEHYRTGPDNTVERPAIGRRSSECQVDCANLIIPGDVHMVAPTPVGGDDMPRVGELLTSVRDFLHGDVMAATDGRTNFLARVAGNSLDIVQRELEIGPELRSRSVGQLQTVLGSDETDLDSLRWDLVRRLRDRSIDLDHAGLADHLRESVVNAVAIDQPKYLSRSSSPIVKTRPDGTTYLDGNTD